jgi:hypothetical protein
MTSAANFTTSPKGGGHRFFGPFFGFWRACHENDPYCTSEALRYKDLPYLFAESANRKVRFSLAGEARQKKTREVDDTCPGWPPVLVGPAALALATRSLAPLDKTATCRSGLPPTEATPTRYCMSPEGRPLGGVRYLLRRLSCDPAKSTIFSV